ESLIGAFEKPPAMPEDIYFAILRPGSAQNPHVLRVRSGFSALSGLKLPSTITPGGPGSKERLWISRHYALNKSNWLLL
ncbi:hypothetical protein, partial [Escherichia coli]|uniref:hypothetical protein n=1 Tax=Escherichia coli TaxID=562 RepID=UPI001BC86384